MAARGDGMDGSAAWSAVACAAQCAAASAATSALGPRRVRTGARLPWPG